MTARGEAELRWKEERYGRCSVCRRPGRLIRHHVVYQQHIRPLEGDLWDLRNALDLGLFCRCHANHHAAVRRISLSIIPDEAVAFAIDLFGVSRAAMYFARYYDATPDDGTDVTVAFIHKKRGGLWPQEVE